MDTSPQSKGDIGGKNALTYFNFSDQEEAGMA